MMTSQIGGDIIYLILLEICYSAHPGSETPYRRHLSFSGKVCIGIQNLLRSTKENKEVHCFILHKQLHRRGVSIAEITSYRSRSMHKHSITAVAEEEWNRLVHIRSFRTLRISNKEIEFLADLIDGS